MATPEQNHIRNSENIESQRLIDSFGLRSQLDRLHLSLGDEIQRPDDSVPDKELNLWRETILDTTILTTFREFSATNEIHWRMKTIQHQDAISELLGSDKQPKEGQLNIEDHRREMVVANKAMTYNEYLPAVIEQVHTFMDLYETEFRQLLPYLPEEEREHLQAQYRQAVEYMFILKRRMDDRRHFASLSNLNTQIAQVERELSTENPDEKPDPERRADLMERVQEYRRYWRDTYNMLSPESKEVVDELMYLDLDLQVAEKKQMLSRSDISEEDRRQLEQSLQELLQQREQKLGLLSQASKERISEKSDEYKDLPPAQRRLEIKSHYRERRGDYMEQMDTDLFEILKGNPEGQEHLGIEKDFLPQRLYLQAIQLRYNQLREVQILVAKKEDWSEQHRAEVQEELSRMRKSYMDTMVMVTQQLAGHHVVMSELTTIQEQFGHDYNLTDARENLRRRTSQETIDHVNVSVDGARDFHLERQEAMLNQVEQSFNPNGLQEIVDLGTMELLEVVNGLSGRIRNLITAALPEGATKTTIDAWLDSNLPLAIQESLETGVGPDGEPLTKEEKLQRIRDVILRFRDTHAVERYRETVNLLQGMPPASQFVGEMPVEPLPEGEIRTEAEKDRLLREHNGATVYAMLFRQMKGDAEAFHDAYKNFLDEMEQLVDIRLGLIAEINMIKESWKSLAWAMFGAAGGAMVMTWVAAGVGAGVAANMAWKTATAPLRLLRGGTSTSTATAVPTAAASAESAEAVAAGRAAPSTIGRIGGAALLGYKSYLEFREMGEIAENIEAQRTQLVSELLTAGFEADPPEQEKTFRYKDGGTEIVVNLDEINRAQRGQESAQGVRSLATAAEALAVLRFGVGRMALPLAAIEISVEIVVYGMDQEADRKFVLKAPSWLLARINMEQATGDSAYDILYKASGEMMSDSPFNDAEDSQENREKREMREKMLFAILNTELREFPELGLELYGGSDHALFLKEFYEGDGGFKDLFLPVFYSRLLELSGNGLTWEEVSKGQIDSDWNIPLPSSPNISLVEIRRAMRETIVFYLQHKREEQYLRALADRDRLQAEVAAGGSGLQQAQMQLEIVEDMIRALGETKVFGQKLKNVEVGAFQRNNGKTRAQLAGEYLYDHAEDVQFSVPEEEIPGLPEGISFGARGAIYRRCIEDIGMRNDLERVFPQTTDEPEGGVYDPILLSLFTAETWNPATDRDARAKQTHYVRLAADWVSDDAGVPRTAENASEEAGRRHMTNAAITLMAKESNRTRLSRSEEREENQRRGAFSPVIFTSFDTSARVGYMVGNDYPRMITLVNSLQSPPSIRGEEFSPENLVATFIEARILHSGQAVALATHVYGDPESTAEPPEFFVVQQARATFGAGRNITGDTQGDYRVFGGCKFLEQAGARDMLAKLEGPLEERRQRAIEWRRERLEQERRRVAEEQARAAEENDPETSRTNFEALLHRSPTTCFNAVEDKWGESASRMRYTDERANRDFLIQMVPEPGPSISAAHTPRSGIQRPSSEFKFTIENSGKTWTIRSASFLRQEDISDADKRLILSVVSAPIHEDDERSLRKVLNLFPHQIYISDWYENHYYKMELMDNLLPLYRAVPSYASRKRFLRTLFNLLNEAGSITEESAESLTEYFREQKNEYRE